MAPTHRIWELVGWPNCRTAESSNCRTSELSNKMAASVCMWLQISRLACSVRGEGENGHCHPLLSMANPNNQNVRHKCKWRKRRDLIQHVPGVGTRRAKGVKKRGTFLLCRPVFADRRPAGRWRRRGLWLLSTRCDRFDEPEPNVRSIQDGGHRTFFLILLKICLCLFNVTDFVDSMTRLILQVSMIVPYFPASTNWYSCQ